MTARSTQPPTTEARLARGKEFVLETFDCLNEPEGEAYKRRWLGDEFASVRDRDSEQSKRTLEIFYESNSEEVSFADALLIEAGSRRSAEARNRIDRTIRAVMRRLKGQ